MIIIVVIIFMGILHIIFGFLGSLLIVFGFLGILRIVFDTTFGFFRAFNRAANLFEDGK